MKEKKFIIRDLELSSDEVVTLRMILDHVTPADGHSVIAERQRQIELLNKIKSALNQE